MRERSFWAWGYTDELPGEDERKRLGTLAGAVLGGATLEPRDPPTLESLELAPSRLEVPATLAGFVTDARAARASHTYGKSYRDLVRGLAGDFARAPDVVATPPSEEAISELLEWASTNAVAVIPYGGGTSVVGGTEAEVPSGYAGVVSLDMGALDAVHEIDEVSRCARIGAGAKGPALERALAARGLTLRFFPQSFEFSTLGGWIATRAGGHFATVETHIDDLVASTRAITPAGSWQTRRLPGSGAGPAPDRLMLGSEGALGVLTEAWVRVRPRPAFRSRATVAFDEWSAATGALRALAQSRLYPANCRLLDAREAMLHQVAGPAGKQLLLIGFEAADRSVEHACNDAVAIATKSGGQLVGAIEHRQGDSARGAGAAESWRQSFLRTPYLFSALVSLGLVVDTFETAISWDRFEALHRAVKGAALEVMMSLRGTGLVTTRITHVYPDGLAPYYTFMTTADPGEELEVWSAIKVAVSDALLAAGGTITHHHAVGRMHDPWYQKQRPPLFGAALAAVKAELDPAGILNPGVVVPGDQLRRR